MSIAPSPWELAARHFEKTSETFASPLDMAVALDPRVERSADLDLINDKLVKLHENPGSRLIVSMAPQRGKSTLCSHWFPVWSLTQRPVMRVTLASYQHNIARTFGRKVRDTFVNHSDRLGLQVRSDMSAQDEWELETHGGGMYSTGVGGSLTSKPSDLMIIDDPTRGHQEANSPTYQERTYEWYTGTALSRLATGKNEASIVIVLTRWSDKDLAGQVMSAEPDEWEFIRIPAQADHNPDEGETDPLGREPGEWLQDVRGTTAEQWERRKKASGPYTWSALYQGKPTPPEGGIFPRDLPTYEQPLWIPQRDGSMHVPGAGRMDTEIIQSWDLTFKDTQSSDYVVGQVWLRVGATVYLLDQVRGRMDFNRSVQAVQDLSAKWPEAAAKFVEDKANGTAVMNSLQQKIAGLIPVEPDGGKEARAHAVSPFFHAGNVHLPDVSLLPNVHDLRDEMINFPNASHDDTVDAMTQAVNQLLLKPINQSQGGYLEDLYGGFHISDY